MSVLKRLFKKRSRETYTTVRVDSEKELPAHLYWHGSSPVFLLPPELLTWHGTQRYVAQHPLVQAIVHGKEALERFYAEFKPANLAQMYGVTDTGLKGAQLPPWRLPWCPWDEQRPPQPEHGLGVEHGISYYGPCTPQKIDTEYQRLRAVAASIQAKGYQPDLKDGHIEGLFMRSGAHYRFYVQGGKHRAAALVALGFERIPVRVRSTWPRQIVAGTEQDWPLVRDGHVAPELAARILARYFQD